MPQAFVVTAGQPNAETVARFLEILMWQGIEVYEMTNELWVKAQQDRRFSRDAARQLSGLRKPAAEKQCLSAF